MNLQRRIKILTAMKIAALLHFVERNFGQNGLLHLSSIKSFMPSPLSFVRSTVICFCWSFLLAVPAVFGQTNYYATNGTEYAIIGALPGDQVFPDAAVTP